MKNKIWSFDNTFEKLPKIYYRKVNLNPVDDPKLIYFNEDLASELGFEVSELKKEVGVFSGSEFPEVASSISMAYMGDQYGNLTVLGDGRAVLLGEILDKEGNRLDIQLKGSGRTPYSRGGDGRAVLGPMLKEYLFSEALFHLNIPTTRSLAVTTTGNNVIREVLSKGAVLTRTASSHLRVGTFQLGYYRGNKEDLKALANYAIERHYPETEEHEEKYLRLFEKVLIKQASLIAKWMSVGFVHGVMNTDNMTISGETIDYGPCAFIDKYDLSSVYSSIDRYGRYAFGQQANIGLWNLARLGDAMSALVADTKEEAISKINSVLQNYAAHFFNFYYKEMTKKIGIFENKEADNRLVNELLALMEKYEIDYTNTFLDFSKKDFSKCIYQNKDFLNFINKLDQRHRLQKNTSEEITELMLSSNPQIIPRNFWVEEAIKMAENGDYALFDELLEALKTPFTEEKLKEKFKIVPENRKYITYCGT